VTTDEHAYPVEVARDVLIPMPDGAHLAATLHRPAADGRWPAIITLMPYHKDGRGGRGSTEAVHHHFARRGYAALTVDLRGLGGSEGLNAYPFDPQERRDGHAAVEWAAGQPWCTGNVGMWGTSYGGITALSVASTRPPHLRTIIPVHACSDIYEDFLRPGGCRGGSWSEGDWGARMIAYNLTPPLRQDPDGRWARQWLERLEHARPWILSWHEHPSHDDFWRARAIPYNQIEVPVFAVCGWRDLYPDATVTYYQGINAPKRLLMGPWKHVFPDLSPEEPVGFLREMDRWWDRWLKGAVNGIGDEPPVTLYVQGARRWRETSAWPPPGTAPYTLYCTPARTLETRPPAGDADPLVWHHDPTVGLASIPWDPWAAHVTRPADHSPDDHRSLTYDTSPLARPLEVIGTPTAALHLAAGGTDPRVVVRLCDVAPDGSSTLVTTGWASGIQTRDTLPTKISLRPTAYAFQAGHRLRLSISGADFPRLWPDPRAQDLGVYSSSRCPSRVDLPVAPHDPGAAHVFGPPASDLHAPAVIDGSEEWTTQRTLQSAVAALDGVKDEAFRIDEGARLYIRHRYRAAVEQDHPQTACVTASTTVRVERPVGAATVSVELIETTTALRIAVEITLEGQPYFARQWDVSIGASASDDRPADAARARGDHPRADVRRPC